MAEILRVVTMVNTAKGPNYVNLTGVPEDEMIIPPKGKIDTRLTDTQIAKVRAIAGMQVKVK